MGCSRLLPVMWVVEKVVDRAGVHHKHHRARAVAKQAEVLAAKYLEVASARRVPCRLCVPVLYVGLAADGV